MVIKANQEKIAVIGGTGKAGQYLINHLINNGFNIRVLVRNPEKLELRSDLMEIITGDVRDYASVESLLHGCTALISTLGQSKGEEPLYSLAAGNIIKAMRTLNIKRYIMVTGLSIDTPQDQKRRFTRFLTFLMKLNFRRMINDKQKEYSILSGSDLDWTVVRVPYIDQSDATLPLKVSLTDCPGNKISTTDLAHFLIAQLTDQRFIRKAPFIANL